MERVILLEKNGFGKQVLFLFCNDIAIMTGFCSDETPRYPIWNNAADREYVIFFRE